MVPSSPGIRAVPEGVQLPTGTEAISVISNIVTDGYFGTNGVPLVADREFQFADRADSPRVATVNEQFVRKY